MDFRDLYSAEVLLSRLPVTARGVDGGIAVCIPLVVIIKCLRNMRLHVFDVNGVASCECLPREVFFWEQLGQVVDIRIWLRDGY